MTILELAKPPGGIAYSLKLRIAPFVPKFAETLMKAEDSKTMSAKSPMVEEITLPAELFSSLRIDRISSERTVAKEYLYFRKNSKWRPMKIIVDLVPIL